jgi:hypothetical protein
MEEAHEALPHVLALDRRAVRAQFERRFSAERMARDYVEVYEMLTRPVAVRREKTPSLIANRNSDLYPSVEIATAARSVSAA